MLLMTRRHTSKLLINGYTSPGFISVHSSALAIPFQVQIRSNFVLSSSSDDLGTCVSFLQACASHGNLSKGKEIHSRLVIRGFQTSPFAITSLINLYSKCSRPIDALSVFRRAQDPNLFAWNAIVACLATNGFPEEALLLYGEMRRGTTSNVTTTPDKFTYPCVIKACSDLEESWEVKRIHGETFKCNLASDAFVSSALVKCYINVELVEDAERAFEELPERDVVLWNAMVNGFARAGRFSHALEFFRRMRRGGINPSNFTVTGVISVFAASGDYPSGRTVHGLIKKSGYESYVAVSNSLIDMYGKCRAVDEATEIFEAMSERDVLSWNSILSVLQQCGEDGGTLRLFHQMRRAGAHPDAVTISAVLPACAHLAALMHGRLVHGYMIVNGLQTEHDVFVDNSVMDMYAKCGNLRDARLVFDGMDGRDVASWNILIGGYATNGRGLDALGLFSSMRDARVAPDEVTFVGVLSACSHAGLVGPGKEILDRMKSDYNVVPTVEHYACVVDMLGRAGKLEAAHVLAAHMPIGSNTVVWRAYLAACRVHGDTGRAVDAASRLLEMEPEHCGSYVLLSNVYGSAGRYGEVSVVRSSMRDRNVRKTPGCSWIELGSGMHVFVTGDRVHPESGEIYAQLHVLVGRLREFGYAPDVRQGE